MSSTAFACPVCHVPLRLAAAPGRKVRCGRCGSVFDAGTAPAGASTQTLDPKTLSAPPAAPPSDLCLRPSQQPGELGRLGPYRVLKVLGQGGMGRVYQAEDTLLQRAVALKVLLPAYAADVKARQRFLREARAAAALEHDNVVTIHQVGEDNGTPYLAMPLLKGESLEDRLRRDGKLPVAEAVRVGREVAEGLAAAHERGLIHRDIKPGNLWLENRSGERGVSTPRYRVKILDFGLARPAAGGQDNSVTETGAILGTPAYMAPEQARGEEVDGRADLFSLGCVLYRVLTGKQAFPGKDTMSVLMSLASHTPSPPAALDPAVPWALSALVMRLLSKDRQRRPTSARAVADELAALPADPTPTQPLPPPVKARLAGSLLPHNRRRAAVLAGLGVLLLIPVGCWLALAVLRTPPAPGTSSVDAPDPTKEARGRPADAAPPQEVRRPPGRGTLVVEVNDPQAAARFRAGRLVVTAADDTARYTLRPDQRRRELAAGAYRAQVEGADGLVLDRPAFTLDGGGTVTVRVTTLPRPAADNPGRDPDRTAAEWVLSVGGTLFLDGAVSGNQVVKLPRQDFQLTLVTLRGDKVNDAGLAHFEGCRNLIYLDLANPNVTDDGLAHLRDCTNLSFLSLAGTRITDRSLALLKNFKNLKTLHLNSTRVSDAGLAQLKGATNLAILSLNSTDVSDTGLAHFKEYKNLAQLYLDGTQVTDAGMAELKECKKLHLLNLSGTRVGDAGLRHIGECQTLASLDLGGTRVGSAGLMCLKGCKNLTGLCLSGTGVGDADMAILRGYEHLTDLHLGDTQIGDAGLTQLKECKKLTRLFLDGTRLSDSGVDQLKECKSLTSLGLMRTKVTAPKVEELKKALPECRIFTDTM